MTDVLFGVEFLGVSSGPGDGAMSRSPQTASGAFNLAAVILRRYSPAGAPVD
ncbi:MAG TPA: hypothetical protein VFL82_13780 [Thermomicrobiales bacterium]|nr:hypothetical protein [Thermomicrobiales bacterium]